MVRVRTSKTSTSAPGGAGKKPPGGHKRSLKDGPQSRSGKRKAAPGRCTNCGCREVS
jgi:hypothetical protein